MADHLGSPPHDPQPKGWLTKARGHLVDVTPLRISNDFRHLFVGRSVSDFGDEIVAVVIPFQVYDLTGSTFAVGMLGLVELVPVFVFPIVGGAFADALERRKLTIASHAILALMSVLMAVNALRDEPLLWPLYVFAFVSAGLYTFNRPALSTWPARLLEPGLLPSANALEAGFGTLDSMLGPVAAGVLLATIAPEGAFLFDAVTFLVVIWQIARMHPSPPSDENNDVSWEAIKDGFRFLRGKRTLQTVFLADLNAMVLGFPIALFPAVADRLGGDGVSPELALGLLYAALAAGAFLATLFSGRAKHVHRQGRAILIAVAVWGAAIVGFGLSDALWPALVMLAVAGAGDMVSGIYRSTILQVAVEDRLRGRLEGIGMAVWATGPSVGNVESGVVASITSVPFSIVSGGLLTVVGVVVLRWFAPGFWRYDARHPRI
jgi:MFS family permease